ncbi:MAG: helix-turn-helix transcriptional regulator [Gammaproteobacteria bacterium]|nr:helix-turn-helix transcriptional regulator [Gammaproteobacteria bacterium]
MENLAKNLKTLIERESISEAELSRRCGVTQPMINRIVNAKTDNPKLKTLLRISRYFGISISELVEAKMLSQISNGTAADIGTTGTVSAQS